MPASKLKLKKLAPQLLCVFVGCQLIVLVGASLLGFGWHMLYGDKTSFQQWTVPVPKGFHVMRSKNEIDMWKLTFGTPLFDMPYGYIHIFLRPSEQRFLFEKHYSKVKNNLVKNFGEDGYKLRSERTVAMREGVAYCLEYWHSTHEQIFVGCPIEGSTLDVTYKGNSRYEGAVFTVLENMTSGSKVASLAH